MIPAGLPIRWRRWCKRHEVSYVIGMARNPRLQRRVAAWEEAMKQAWRESGEKGTELAKAATATICSRLLKIGASVIRNTRRIRIVLASHPPAGGFLQAAQALAPSMDLSAGPGTPTNNGG